MSALTAWDRVWVVCTSLRDWRLEVPGGGVPRAVYVLAVNALRLGCHPEYLWLLKEGQLSAQVPMERNVDGD